MSGRNEKHEDATTTPIIPTNAIHSLQEPLLPPPLPPATTTTVPITAFDVQPVSFDHTNEFEAATAAVEDNGVRRVDVDVDVDVDVVMIDEEGWEHGEVQTNSFCRDWLWGFLFLLQFVTVGTIAVIGIRTMIKEGSEWIPTTDNDDDDHHEHNDDDDGGGIDWNILWFLLSLMGAVVVIAVILLTVLLGPLAPMLIQISLVLSPLCVFLTFVVSLVTLNVPVALASVVMLGFQCFYACHVWHKVPFATANLNIALRAIKDNHGLWILAYGATIKAYVWVFLWWCAVAELVIFSPSWVYDCSSNNNSSSNSSNNNDDDDVCRVSTQGKFIAIGMVLSLFWTLQVVQNIFHTTIAGVVGTWWFDPDEARSAAASTSVSTRGGNNGGCFRCCGCSPAIYHSLHRSVIYSFGSICLGSLLVGIVQVLQFIVRCGRRQRSHQQQQQRRFRQQRRIEATDLLCCFLQYLVDSLEQLLEYFNTWAFVYVGLYGYDYWTAGKAVAALFQARGWSVIINDHLVARSLSMMSVLIGLITGLVGVLFGVVFLGRAFDVVVPAFLFGAILGGTSAGILLGVVTSAVNTVVVCFAESPNQLRINHDPAVSQDLLAAWRKAYPHECGF